MLFGSDYFTLKVNGNKVKINTDKEEFDLKVKDGKVELNIESTEIHVCCGDCTPIPEIEVEDNKPKTTKKKTLDTVC